MSIKKTHFGFMPEGEEIFLYELDNGKNVKAEIINYGGIIKNLWVKDKNGNFVDVVLGRDTLEEYFENTGCFGAFIGRFANRIGNSKFTLNGTEYSLFANNGKNSLHGGKKGFDKYVLKESSMTDSESPSVTFEMLSPDGDEGYPGNLRVKLTYEINASDGLLIHYEAVSDKDTIINLTNHSYFNLDGASSGDALGHSLWMNCPFYTPNTNECMPRGEILSVEGTPFDFLTEKKVGDVITADCEQLTMFKGFDHNFVIEGTGFRKAATLTAEKSGIVMDVYTDKPGVQFYSCNGTQKGRVCKDGAIYPIYGGLCLETQFFPNSTTFSHFPSPVFKAREVYDYKTEYRFSVK